MVDVLILLQEYQLFLIGEILPIFGFSKKYRFFLLNRLWRDFEQGFVRLRIQQLILRFSQTDTLWANLIFHLNSRGKRFN